MVYNSRGSQLIYPDPVLSNISVGWAANSDQFIGQLIFPDLRTTTQAGKYYVFGLEAWQLPFQGDLRAPGSRANEIPGISVSSDEFFLHEHALEVRIPEEERENLAGSPLDPYRDGAELVVSKLLLQKEWTIQNMVRDSTRYPTGHVVTLSGTSQWNDHTNSNPVSDIRTAQSTIHGKLFRPANTAIVPYEVMLKLEDHPKLTARIASTQAQITTPQLIASVFGVERILVPGSGYISDTNPPVAGNIDPTTVSYMWGKDVWLGYVPPRPAPKTPAFGYNFWMPTQGQKMPTDRRLDRDQITEIVRTRFRYQPKIVTKDSSGDSYAGYLIKNAVA